MGLTNALYYLKATTAFFSKPSLKLNHTLKPVYYTGLRGPKMQW
jgi:hypothetical protein